MKFRSGCIIEPLERRTLLSGLRPTAVPLVAFDPYLSVWSESNNLTDTTTHNWTGTNQPLVSLIRIDGANYRLMGTDPSTTAAFPQTNLTVTPTRSIYDFDNGHVHVTLTFMTPRLPSNLNVLSWPLTYLNWDIHSVDGLKHNVQLYYSTGSELAVNTTDQQVTWGRSSAGPDTALHVGTTAQTIYNPAGDGVRIDWGYAYTAANAAQSKNAVGGDAEMIAAFENTGFFFSRDDTNKPRAVSNDEPVMAFDFQLGNVGAATTSRHVIVAYDELYEVDYFGKQLLPYWKRNGMTMGQLLQQAEASYPTLVQQCTAFDNSLMTDMTIEGGTQYAQIAALAYRQSLAAQGLAADANGQPLLFTKEQTSNGDIATVDVMFPGNPMLFFLSPTLAKASLVPVLAYAASSQWTFTNAPHDLGTYPVAVGRPDGGEAMPVEESANMLIMVDAVAHEENSAEFASQYWPELTQWATFLEPYAVDPGNQLTTDDFLGTINHSTNLAVKAIEALGAYAQLCKLRGDLTDYASFTNLAKADVTHWLSVATQGNHFSLAYNDTGTTWSQLYNLVWDKVLGLNLFPSYVASEQVAFYKTVMQTYGVAVESTTNTAKTDWSVWTATLANNLSDFQTLITPVYNYLNTTSFRAPLPDSYDVTNVNSTGFYSRSVVGGVFMKMLADPAMWKKYSSQDHTQIGVYAPFPVETVILATAQTAAQTWAYTTATPASNWTSNSFNDSSWATGLGGFGTAGTPGTVVNTTWNTADIYLRKSFTMPVGNFAGLQFLAYHDEDMQIYVNGILAVSVTGYITSYQTFAIAPAALALLTSGATVELAVHCHQTVGGQDIDVGLVNIQ